MTIVYLSRVTLSQAKRVLAALPRESMQDVEMVLPLYWTASPKVLLILRDNAIIPTLEKALRLLYPEASTECKSLTSTNHLTQPVIVLAAPRSGSTLLFETLAGSPDSWTIGHESPHILDYGSVVGPGGHSKSVLDAPLNHCSLVRAAFWASAFSRDQSRLIDEVTEGVCTNVRLIEKTPRNCLRIDYLKSIFPDAYFVFLYRKPIPNISSLLEGWLTPHAFNSNVLKGRQWKFFVPLEWEGLIDKTPEEISVIQWCSANEAIVNALSSMSSDRWIPLTYDDLVADAATQIGRVCQHVGLSVDKQFAETLASPLPLSKAVLSKPNSSKTSKHLERLRPYLEQTLVIEERVNALIAQWERTDQSSRIRNS